MILLYNDITIYKTPTPLYLHPCLFWPPLMFLYIYMIND